MDKGIRKLCIKILLLGSVILIPTIFSFVVVNFFPAHFITGNYGVHMSQMDYAKNDHTYNRILVIGDSIAQVSYMPQMLSGDTYNFAMGSETPVDGWYKLMEYVEAHGKPQYMFCTYNLSEFYSQGSIWSSSINMHSIPYDMALTILQDARNFDADSGLLVENAKMQLLEYRYGIHPKSVKMSVNALIYNILNGGGCYAEYLKQCAWVKEHKGHWKHHISHMTGNETEEFQTTEDGGFYVTEMADHYMRKIIEYCESNQIQFIYETVPLNEATFQSLNRVFTDTYEDYWAKLSQDYPGAVINGELSYYENEYFGDSMHLNSDGTERFSAYIKEKYDTIFEEQ